MGPFDALSLKAEERGLRFIVIGGHAVIGHGYIRATDDADIMVNREKREQWVKLMTDLGYALHHDGGSFLQFSAPNETEWDIDWMLAPAETFNRMLSEAKPEQVDRIHVVIPKLEHLFALKLHATKHGPGLRKLKDVDDIIRLAILNHFDVPNRFGPYVKSTRTKKCMKESARACTE